MKRFRTSMLAVFFTALFLLSACGRTSYLEKKNRTGENPEKSRTETSGEKTEGKKTKEKTGETAGEQTCAVHVAGAVNAPGVVYISPKARVHEAIEAAGGLREDADGDSLNQAETVKDGQKILVLTKEEAAQERSSLAEGTAAGGKVRLNTATKEQLMTLPGIGESKAEAILSWRKEHGSFSSVDDLSRISGIKEGVISKFRDRVTVE